MAPARQIEMQKRGAMRRRGFTLIEGRRVTGRGGSSGIRSGRRDPPTLPPEPPGRRRAAGGMTTCGQAPDDMSSPGERPYGWLLTYRSHGIQERPVRDIDRKLSPGEDVFSLGIGDGVHYHS